MWEVQPFDCTTVSSSVTLICFNLLTLIGNIDLLDSCHVFKNLIILIMTLPVQRIFFAIKVTMKSNYNV